MTTQPSDRAASQPVRETVEPVVLRGALGTPETEQSVTLRLVVRTQTGGASHAGDASPAGTTRRSAGGAGARQQTAGEEQPGTSPAIEARDETLDLDVAGTLSGATSQGGLRQVDLTLARVRVRIERRVGKRHQLMEYSTSSPDKNSALDRLLSGIAGLKLTLTLREGELVSLKGITAFTRDRRLGLPPELEMLSALLRDASFERIVADALFPRLPSTALLESSTFEILQPTGLLDLCVTSTRLRGRLVRRVDVGPGATLVMLEETGTIALDGACRGLNDFAGETQVKQQVCASDHSLQQRSVRRLHGRLAATGGPASNGGVAWSREETLTGMRGGAAARTQPE